MKKGIVERKADAGSSDLPSIGALCASWISCSAVFA